MTRELFNNKIIDDAVCSLKSGGVIVVPTDTVYGFAIDSTNKVAFDKVYKIKKRQLDKKLPIVVDTYNRLVSICEVDVSQLNKLKKFYPGPLTLVLKLRNREDTVAVRMINNEIINKIIEKLKCQVSFPCEPERGFFCLVL